MSGLHSRNNITLFKIQSAKSKTRQKWWCEYCEKVVKERSRSQHLSRTYKNILRLKNNNAPGMYGIPAEVLNYRRGAIQSKIFELILRIWEVEQRAGQ